MALRLGPAFSVATTAPRAWPSALPQAIRRLPAPVLPGCEANTIGRGTGRFSFVRNGGSFQSMAGSCRYRGQASENPAGWSTARLAILRRSG